MAAPTQASHVRSMRVWADPSADAHESGPFYGVRHHLLKLEANLQPAQ